MRQLVAIFLVAILTACASIPVQEINDAQQAIDSARLAGGEWYTPETLRTAEVLVSRALDDLAHGDYHAARVAALSAKQRATFAREASLSVQAR